VLIYKLPSLAEMEKAGKDGRMNIFRRYFASSRYNRLLIQQALVQSAHDDDGVAPDVAKMEQSHNLDFSDTVKRVKKYGYYDEFLDAVKEEADALQKIIEAYDRRMNPD
jgi:hypothetical protein